MSTQLRQRYEQESILYLFLRQNVLNRDVVQEFRNTYLRTIKDGDDDSTVRREQFKNEPELFLQPDRQAYVDTREFQDIILHIESFYQDKIADFTQFRRYQYITLFISFVFCKLHDNQEFKTQYLSYIADKVLSTGSSRDYSGHITSTFNRLGYWMATASGKTILMYAIVYLYQKLIAPDTKTLYILVPTDELRTQHKTFMGMFENFGGSEKDSIIEIREMKLFGDTEVNVKLTTLSKMTGDESGRNLDNNAIMMFDEAHKGAGSTKEDSATEQLKNAFIAKSNNFLFEFSATFQKAFEADAKRIKELETSDKNIFDRYIFSSVFKYNLFDFNTDGFGKQYYVNNLTDSNDSDDEGKRRLICDSLVHLALQLIAYENLKKELRDADDKGTYIILRDETKIFQPLYMGLSWKLGIDDQSGTSLVDILKHIRYVFSHYGQYKQYISQKAGDLYYDELKIRDIVSPERIYEVLTGLQYHDGGATPLQLRYDKQVDEIKLILGNKKMLINSGSNSKLADTLKEHIPDMFSLQEQFGTGGKRFQEIDKNSDILYVFGSKKFIEGRDSKRPSTIMLFKMGKGSTVIATQILGRGLRLAGRSGDGFRHIGKRLKYNAHRKHSTHLIEYVGLFGYEIDEFKKFIEQLSGDILYLRITRARQFTPSFISYLKLHGIDSDNIDQVNQFLSKNFQYISQSLEDTKNIIESASLQISQEQGEVGFNLQWEKDNEMKSKSIGTIQQSGHKLVSRTQIGSLIEGQTGERDQLGGNLYTGYSSIVFGKLGIEQLTQKIKQKYSHWQLKGLERETIENLLGMITIQTDYITTEQAEGRDYQFDFFIQKKLLSLFSDHIFGLFETIENRNKAIKEKSIEDHTLALTTSNFIQGLVINLGIKKGIREYKLIKDVFELDDSIHQIDEDYDDLTDTQKSIVKPFLSVKPEDLHFYERLFYIPLSSVSTEEPHLHDVDSDIYVDGTYIDLHDFGPEPIDMKLNKNEETRIESLLDQIKIHKAFEKYDVFYLRNLVGAGGISLVYENDKGEQKRFYPDFLFWFINKDNQQKTVIYYEPKSAIDNNRWRKQETLDQVVGRNVEPLIAQIFDGASRGETFWGGKVF